jgi:hypothetical protein
MLIKILKGEKRHKMICERADKTVEIVDLGPVLPFHDIAHFVVEKGLNIKQGFYGNIESGYSFEALNDKVIIKTLPTESMASEIITRTFQTLTIGASSIEQFDDMILEEFRIYNIDYPITWDSLKIQNLLEEYQTILSDWHELKEGEILELVY